MSVATRVVTMRGLVDVVHTGDGQRGVFLRQGSVFLGVVAEESVGTYVVYPNDRRVGGRHTTCLAAVLWLGNEVV